MSPGGDLEAVTDADRAALRRAFEMAFASREHGNRPFGAALGGPGGEVLLTAEATVLTERDCAGHAEVNALREASSRFDREYLVDCTLYASSVPCVMCAGTLYWSNVRRLVFGLSMPELLRITGGPESSHIPAIDCHEVLERAPHEIEIVGPLLEDEAARCHEGYWS